MSSPKHGGSTRSTMAKCCRTLRDRAALPAAWIALVLLLVMGVVMGAVQLALGLLMVIASPLVRWFFLAVVRQVYPTRVGIVHVWFMLFVRKYFQGDRKHAMPIRVDLDDRVSVHVVAGLLDNYSYIIVERKPVTPGAPLRCCVVDPGDSQAVIEALQELREQHYAELSTRLDEHVVVLTAILVTHKHWDHQAGVRAVLKAERGRTARAASEVVASQGDAQWLSEIAVIAGEHERGVECCTQALAHGARFKIGLLEMEVVESPCHTAGHVMFALLKEADVVEALFTGDTLFCGGCGAPFEGKPADMAHNFRAIYHRCPENALLFPGHEYSEALLTDYFGGSSQPTPGSWGPRQFAELCHALQRARDSRAHDRPSVPVRLNAELAYNKHFASLHAAAASLADAFRLFDKITHAASSTSARSEIEMSPKFSNGEIELADLRRPRESPLGFSDNGEVKKTDEDPPLRRRSRSKEPKKKSEVIQHRVSMRPGWKPGKQVSVRCSGVDFELEVPEGVEPRGSFIARMPRDRLPPILTYVPSELDDTLSTVWRRDLERLNSLLIADKSVLAGTLTRSLLVAPLSDVANDDDQPPPQRSRRRGGTKLPRPHYRPSDEAAARRRAGKRDQPDQLLHMERTAPYEEEQEEEEDGLSTADSYRVLLEMAIAAEDDFPGWREALADSASLKRALWTLSASADGPDTDFEEAAPAAVAPDEDIELGELDKKTISDHELRRALTRMGPRPLTMGQVDDLLVLASVAGCCDDAALARSPRRAPSDTPVMIHINRLAHTLGTERLDRERPPPPCTCFGIVCRRRKRRMSR